jgi:protein phosphatase
LGSTLKCTPQTSWPTPDQKHKRRSSGEDTHNGSISPKDNTHRKIFVKLDFNILAAPFPFKCCLFICPFIQKTLARSAESSLALEVIAGPCHGICCSRQSTSPTLPIILGRVPPSDLVLKDSEVSGKHARISWNVKVCCSGILDLCIVQEYIMNQKYVQSKVHKTQMGSEDPEVSYTETCEACKPIS